MRLKLTLNRAGQTGPGDDLLVTLDTTVTVGDLAAAVAARDPRPAAVDPPTDGLTVRIDGSTPTVLPPDMTVSEAAVRSGDQVAVVAVGSMFEADRQQQVAGTLTVVAGPDEGRTFSLRPGVNQIGRAAGNDIRLSDPLVSKQHARVNVAEAVEIIDLNSSNGVLIGGDAVSRAVLRPGDVALLGDTALRVELQASAAAAAGTAGDISFNRSPQLDFVYQGATVEAPEPPAPPQASRLPIVSAIAPVVFGSVMFAITRQLVTVLFVALSPVMVIGNFIENRLVGGRAHRRAMEAWRHAVDAAGGDLRTAAADEAVTRRSEHRSTAELRAATLARSPLLWGRRPDQRGFLDVRLGLGTLPSRTKVELPTRRDLDPALRGVLVELRDRFADVADVPVVAALRDCGNVGVAGPPAFALDVARSVVAQLVTGHSPAEVVLCAATSTAGGRTWNWLKWLPHVGSDHSPLDVEHLAASAAAASRLVSALEDLVGVRAEERRGPEPPALPAVVLLVTDDVPLERSRLVELAEQGPTVGVHVIWTATSVVRLPAACRTFVDVQAPGRGAVGFVDGARQVEEVALDVLGEGAALDISRSLCPVVDAGARVDDESDLPRSVALAALLGTDLLDGADAVLDRWATGGSLPGDDRRGRKEPSLRALVGAASGQTLALDLREHGPHALVGGTTGAGKSEFLQSWVLAMAAEHSPARVTFLFVDYKGGAAFGECVHLPHAVGLVTDLSQHLVRRALTSLHAELRHREEVLRRHHAKDLIELQRRGEPGAPPSLVIVVDEFAALVSEVPEFVDGVVSVAQRGRSLGLHLILATQRPAGVIKDNLRANTNLRIALRMADEGDSTDVVGTAAAAAFDAATPGRALAKTGPGRLTPFQAGYAGAWTSEAPPPPVITVEELGFGVGPTWEPGDDSSLVAEPEGPNDLRRLVAAVRAAHAKAGLEAPRRPWLDELAPVYDVAKMPQSRTDAELVFGILDDPARQRQTPVSFLPDRDGNMAVFGTGGAGKSTLLRTLAVAAGLGRRGGPCHVYGIDFGARGLAMLEPLPHVGAVLAADDHERIQRLLRRLRDTIDDRAQRYAKVNAGSIAEYRKLGGAPDEPRILLLVDNIGAFRQAYEAADRVRWFDTFQSIAADGRQVGVHVVVTADRHAAVPTALASVVQRRLVLRMAGEMEYAVLGAPVDAFDMATPPGRGFLDDDEVQAAVLGGTANTVRQAAAIGHLAAGLSESTTWPAAPTIERLPDRVRLADLPVAVDGLPALGLADDTLAPVGFVPEGSLLVVGPPQSGKTSVLAALAMSMARCDGYALHYFGTSRSPLYGLLPWVERSDGPDEAAELAEKLLASQARRRGDRRQVFVIENVPELLNSAADIPLQELLRAGRPADAVVVADGETSAMVSSWPLLQALKAARHGIALQPDQHDGDTVFKTSFARVSRAEFPPGRGLYVRAGRVLRVQCALPEADPL